MTKIGNIESDTLKQFIQKIEKLEEEKIELMSAIKEVFAEAKSFGLDTKIMKQVIKLRKMKQQELEEQEHLIATYLRALEV